MHHVVTMAACFQTFLGWIQVKINRVSESSPLCDDLRQLRSKFAYGYVEMELTFTMDLYPFYPPLVKLVRTTERFSRADAETN